MSIVTGMARGLGEYVILQIVVVPFVNDPIAIIWYSLAVFLAFILRLAMEYNSKDGLTLKNGIKQTIYTISYCYFAVLFWFSYLNYGKGFEIYLFLNSLFAVFMVGQLKNIIRMGIPAILRIWLKKFLAVEDSKQLKEGEDERI